MVTFARVFIAVYQALLIKNFVPNKKKTKDKHKTQLLPRLQYSLTSKASVRMGSPFPPSCHTGHRIHKHCKGSPCRSCQFISGSKEFKMNSLRASSSSKGITSQNSSSQEFKMIFQRQFKMNYKTAGIQKDFIEGIQTDLKCSKRIHNYSKRNS